MVRLPGWRVVPRAAQAFVPVCSRVGIVACRKLALVVFGANPVAPRIAA